MKKNKGFTLIELLAVLVILAIIALIITPIVTNLIKDARIKTSEDAVSGLLEAVDVYYGRVVMKTNGVFNENSDITLTFGTDGSVTYSTSVSGVELEYDGVKVTGGEIVVDRYGEKYITKDLRVNNYYCARVSASDKTVKCDESASNVTKDVRS